MLLIDDECLLERIVFRANTKRDKAKSFLSKNKNIDTHCIINIIKGLIFFCLFSYITQPWLVVKKGTKTGIQNQHKHMLTVGDFNQLEPASFSF